MYCLLNSNTIGRVLGAPLDLFQEVRAGKLYNHLPALFSRDGKVSCRGVFSSSNAVRYRPSCPRSCHRRRKRLPTGEYGGGVCRGVEQVFRRAKAIQQTGLLFTSLKPSSLSILRPLGLHATDDQRINFNLESTDACSFRRKTPLLNLESTDAFSFTRKTFSVRRAYGYPAD